MAVGLSGARKFWLFSIAKWECYNSQHFIVHGQTHVRVNSSYIPGFVQLLLGGDHLGDPQAVLHLLLDLLLFLHKPHATCERVKTSPFTFSVNILFNGYGTLFFNLKNPDIWICKDYPNIGYEHVLVNHFGPSEVRALPMRRSRRAAWQT
jgi:hypothetical protein